MEMKIERVAVQQPAKRSYHEPLLIRHEPLRNVTGQKYSEKPPYEKLGDEKPVGDESA